MMTQETFETLERAGWSAKAGAYDDMFATITDQAIAHMLDSLGALANKRLLDVACGTGHIAGTAAGRGAHSEGIDFATTMVEQAKARFPGVPFREGDACRLPYENGTFDAVTCGFGLLHMAQPEQAMKEASRVLKSGGRYAFTVWCSPDQGGEFFRLVMGAVQKHGTLNVPLPAAPPMFRFADPNECAKSLMAAGFADPVVTVLPLTWRAVQAEDVLELIYKGAVRTPMVLEAQTEHAREAIHRAILEESEKLRNGGTIEIRFPASMASARKG
jgi:ubiquinone/menaquinone biosynthesis C-methylase UbiE